jgi:MYXO-CTERM domain-containing protein
VTPGKPEDSVLVTRVSLPLEDGDHMPPEGEVQLSADEIALIRAWVEGGASERGQVDVARLPAGAVRAIAAHPPEPPERAASPAGKLLVAQTTPQRRSGGCAACAVADDAHAPNLGPWLAGIAAGGVLAARRRFRLTPRGTTPFG